MDDYNLEPIIEYNMTDEEAFAYKLGLLWIEISKKLFPDDKRVTAYPKRGDPRKGSLFKYCYKMQLETKGSLDPKDYKLFIAAQLQILKGININGQHPLIGPWCLLGDKAWARWKLWKNKFDKQIKSKTAKEVGIDKVGLSEIQIELTKCRKHLKETEDDFKVSVKEMERAIILGKISGFYAVLSPWVKKYCNLNGMDLTYYKNNVSESSLNYFKTVRPQEF